jgi:beta-glucosidase
VDIEARADQPHPSPEPPADAGATGATGSAVHDPDRIANLDGHLRALHEAITVSVDVHGYFVWSISVP